MILLKQPFYEINSVSLQGARIRVRVKNNLNVFNMPFFVPSCGSTERFGPERWFGMLTILSLSQDSPPKGSPKSFV